MADKIEAEQRLSALRAEAEQAKSTALRAQATADGLRDKQADIAAQMVAAGAKTPADAKKLAADLRAQAEGLLDQAREKLSAAQ